MATSSAGSQRVLGTLSVVFGGLGLLLFWFEPFGQLLGATGIALGLAGVLLAVSHGGTRRSHALAGLLISVLALVLSVGVSLAVTGHVVGGAG